jgi:multiple sugar transport system ATP-binding protein
MSLEIHLSNFSESLLGKGSQRTQVISNQWLGDRSHIAAEFANRLIVAVSHQSDITKFDDKVQIQIEAPDLYFFNSKDDSAIAHGLEI